MKKFIIALAALLIGIAANAQFRWGPTLGINISEYGFKQKLLKVDQSCGFEAGVQSELMFPGIGIGLDMGLNYSLHGAKLHMGEYEVWATDGYGTEQSWIHTIQIPVSLKFKYTRLNGLEEKIAPFVYGGPVFSLTVGHNNLKALEYPAGCIMLQCGLGAELYKNFQLSAGYIWAMTYEVRTRKLDNYSAKSRGWRVRLTYLF